MPPLLGAGVQSLVGELRSHKLCGMAPPNPAKKKVKLFEKLPNCFLKRLHHFKFLPAVYEGSNFSTSLSTLVIVHLCDYCHPCGISWWF